MKRSSDELESGMLGSRAPRFGRINFGTLRIKLKTTGSVRPNLRKVTGPPRVFFLRPPGNFRS